MALYNNDGNRLSFEKRKENLKLYYDDEVDALSIYLLIRRYDGEAIL
jgi:hypothetical protein